jgi:hypothetical protein
MSTRKQVYEVIDTERDYQDRRWGPRSNSTAAYLTFMRHWLTRAEQEATKDDDPHRALTSIRKVAALAVACMEEHGAYVR